MNSEILDGWWKLHAELDELIERVHMQLERNAFPAAGELIERLASTLETHSSAEELLYFPLVACVSARSARRLVAARAAHRRLRRSVEELLVSVESTDAPSAQRRLSALLHRLHQHETEEAELIVELQTFARAGEGQASSDWRGIRMRPASAAIRSSYVAR